MRIERFFLGTVTIGHRFIISNNPYDKTDSILTESVNYFTGTNHSHYIIV